jgi:hypothetical protein
MSRVSDSLREIPLFADVSSRDLEHPDVAWTLLPAPVERIRRTRVREVGAAG